MTPVKPVEAPPSGDLYDLFGVEEKARLESEGTDGGSVPEQGELGPGEPKKSKTEPPDSEMTETQAEEEGGATFVQEGDKKGEEEKRPNAEEQMEVGEGEEGDKEGKEEGDPEEEKEDLSSMFPEEEISKIVQCLQSLKKLLENAQHTTVRGIQGGFHIES